MGYINTMKVATVVHISCARESGRECIEWSQRGLLSVWMAGADFLE